VGVGQQQFGVVVNALKQSALSDKPSRLARAGTAAMKFLIFY
jgi:hypothetical protein